MRQLPDTSVARGWRSSLFLFRQPFLLVPGALATVGVAAWLVALTVGNGKATPRSIVTLVAISPLCGFGFAVLTALPLFMLVRAFGEKREFTAKQGEIVIASERANHFLGDEARGGTLTVTDRRIVFVPHRFNVQLARVEQPLDTVCAIEWMRIVDGMGNVFSHELDVHGERVERYVVKDARVVGACIEEASRRTTA